MKSSLREHPDPALRAYAVLEEAAETAALSRPLLEVSLAAEALFNLAKTEGMCADDLETLELERRRIFSAVDEALELSEALRRFVMDLGQNPTKRAEIAALFRDSQEGAKPS